MKLDKQDIAILKALQQDASVSSTELAERVGLSQSPCWRRVNQLEEAGIIQGRVARLARKKLGLEVLVVVNVKLASHGWQSLPKFKQRVSASSSKGSSSQIQTLNRKCITSPSRTMYSLPSRRSFPDSFAPCSPLRAT
ncbi:MAG: Lrp/AsnC family transcriptional regulator [Gammaproteobacteria bacterium]|nr:Lrp/AsnC family transcriptional regulator [Gammaproteobacteria bacterium]